MIDFSREQVLSLKEAAKYVGKRRGQTPHLSVLYRWCSRGLHGVVLESIQVGGTRCTSVEALCRFFGKLSGASPGPPAPDPRPTLHEDTREVLRKAGLPLPGSHQE